MTRSILNPQFVYRNSIIVAVSLVVSACSPYIYPDDFAAAQRACETFGGLKYMSTSSNWATCNNETVVGYKVVRK